MVEGFRYVEKLGIEPAVMVTLTDGFTDFPKPGEFGWPAIWCISHASRTSPTGETVHFDPHDGKK